jgi:hypothetical protein
LCPDQAIYNIEPKSNKVKRRIPLSQLGFIHLSKYGDNFFCLHVPSEYDYLLVSPKKTEIITRILENYEALMGHPLPVTFANT